MDYSKRYKLLSLIMSVLLMGALGLFFVSQNQVNIYKTEIQQLNKKISQSEQILTAFEIKSKHQEEILDFMTLKTIQKIELEHFDLYYDFKSKKGFILGPEIEQIPMNEQYQLWVKGTECLSYGLFTYDEFLDGSDIFDLSINSGEELILTKEKMGGSKTPSSERIISSKIVEL
jgi:hypothetical protein